MDTQSWDAVLRIIRSLREANHPAIAEIDEIFASHENYEGGMAAAAKYLFKHNLSNGEGLSLGAMSMVNFKRYEEIYS
jgi:hypothetical protein